MEAKIIATATPTISGPPAEPPPRPIAILTGIRNPQTNPDVIRPSLPAN